MKIGDGSDSTQLDQTLGLRKAETDMRLLLLRHAKAERIAPGQRDRDRSLTDRGRDDAATIGTYLLRHGYTPDRVLVSSAARTRETWSQVREAFPDRPEAVHEDRMYDATVYDLLETVKASGADAASLMLIGHNPGLHELALLLVASGDLDARQRLGEGFPTAALAIVDFPFDGWEKLHPQSGRLERLITPRTLTQSTD
jgi:phosphohistidine phosphatase